ncbi:hypothetical protein CDV31_001009 [Fusarium ambrosium]|uniref:Uncharacterized protein n=1 Tax=Fusarium ambrosium TaxID=131363 RepID=A0A428V120_9HYPO|nr:hypothetical protein CDV31_001009 [Fusarium ambrosium]
METPAIFSNILITNPDLNRMMEKKPRLTRNQKAINGKNPTYLGLISMLHFLIDLPILDSAWDGSTEPSEQQFVQQLIQDVKSNLGSVWSKRIAADYLGNAVKEFACRLQDESLSAHGFEAGAMVKRHMKYIVQLLTSTSSEMTSSQTGQELLGDSGLPSLKQSSKPNEAILDWSSMVTVTFNLDWNPVRFFRNLGIKVPFEEALPKILCLVGSWDEAQALTVADYMNQTWPESGQPLITLLQELVSLPEGEERAYQMPQPLKGHRPGLKQLSAIVRPESSFSLTAVGGLHFVSEIGEQLSWLASALRPSLTHGRVVGYIPRLRSLRLLPPGTGKTIASCDISIEFGGTEDRSLKPGLCWGKLCCGTVLVKGFPILKRSIPKTGLEMSLAEIATIIGSGQVVRWGQRIIMKGFNMLAIATLAAADIIVWHLLVSDEADERISYVDPRLDELDNGNMEGITLRMLEEKRHVVGWCAAVTDLCGGALANHDVKSSGLQKPPGSIVIDRLYLEAGADVVGGVSMKINSKEQPFWLQRGKDYPSLLKWIGVQPIAFHDVASRRTWLVDGASALLHLVRISLYLDENDPDSTYDWVFDPTQLKDKWDGITGRQAALRTLKSWDNLDLNIYIVDKRRGPSGATEVQYATFGTRVKEVLHSIELLIDRQSKTASQEGIRISQSLDPRREIVGFDVLDVVTPLGPILPRVQHLKSWGHGWIDFMPSIGVTTIFGNGFGDLIRPDLPQNLCQGWKSLPEGKDYMAASISTLQMLYEKRLLRMDPGLKGGEMAKKIIWASFSHPFRPCNCLQRCINKTTTRTINDETQGCHDPVQFFVKKSWPRTVPNGMTPVHLADLDEKGAVLEHIKSQGGTAGG